MVNNRVISSLNAPGFREFLEADPNITSPKAVATRLSKARKIEELIGESLDDIVASDEVTYDTLRQLRDNIDRQGEFSNVLRKYYLFINHRPFPKLRQYETATGLLSKQGIGVRGDNPTG